MRVRVCDRMRVPSSLCFPPVRWRSPYAAFSSRKSSSHCSRGFTRGQRGTWFSSEEMRETASTRSQTCRRWWSTLSITSAWCPTRNQHWPRTPRGHGRCPRAWRGRRSGHHSAICRPLRAWVLRRFSRQAAKIPGPKVSDMVDQQWCYNLTPETFRSWSSWHFIVFLNWGRVSHVKSYHVIQRLQYMMQLSYKNGWDIKRKKNRHFLDRSFR